MGYRRHLAVKNKQRIGFQALRILLRIFLYTAENRINTSVAVPTLFLKSAAFVHSGRTGSIPVSGTKNLCAFQRSPSSGGLFCALSGFAQSSHKILLDQLFCLINKPFQARFDGFAKIY